HERSLSERLTEEPPPWPSPERTAWAARVAPWLRDWPRFMRFAQSGWPSRGVAAASPVVPDPGMAPMVEEPPVAPKPALAPSEKLDLTPSAARAVARFRGDTVAAPVARATPPRPEATPAAPDWPSAP